MLKPLLWTTLIVMIASTLISQDQASARGNFFLGARHSHPSRHSHPRADHPYKAPHEFLDNGSDGLISVK